jgi:HD-GYP domain-containing protein (c-di-GMP phosphodiesterase class II)
VAGSDGTPLAGVVRSGDRLVPVNAGRLGVPPQGLVVMEGHAFQMASVPVDLAEENIGSLAVGSYFDLSDLTTPAVLLRGEKVIQSGIAGVSVAELESALGVCKEKTECEVRLKGVKYLSLPLESVGPGGSATRGEYVLRSLQDVDSATGPVHAVLQRVFVSVAALALLVALIGSVATSRSIGEPLATVMSHLRETERTGVLAEFRTDLSPVQEIRELTESFNRAAVSLREARGGLEKAYVEFVGALANTLDARDPYTAGHSRRVSNLSCAMGSAAGLSAGEVQRIRIGALLHDIGKIGISDLVLRKPGRLTEDEFAVVKQHPVVGRRILEAVQGFAEFLPAVELHHENWNGSGYPHGQRGEETPLDARIIHVADAYDAMTTDRPYRKGMTREQAVGILRAEAGKQFDPAMVEVFTSLDGIAAGPGPAEAEAELHGVAP